MSSQIKPDGKGKWKVIIEADKDPATGKRKRIVRRVEGRKADAEDLMIRLQSELKQGSYIEPSKVTVAKWLDTWLNEYKKMDLRPTTWESYEIMARVHINPEIGALPLQDLRPEHLQKMYNKKIEEGKSTRTIKYIHHVIHSALKQAIKNKLVNTNVSEATTLPKQKKKEVRALTLDEQMKFQKAAEGHRLGAAFLTLLGTGIRRSELLALKWRDIDLKEGIIKIREGVTWTKNGLEYNEPKTAKSARDIQLSTILVDKIQQHKAKMEDEDNYNEDGFVFCTSKGTAIIPRNFNRTFEKLRNDAKIMGVNLHSLRHTFATRMLESGEDLKIVQEILGHVKFQPRQILTHMFQER